MNVLVTGGAGYIGSHAVRHLRRGGDRVVVVDHLVQGHRESLPDDVLLHEIDLRETDALSALMKSERIECVMHFAALANVGESVIQPLRYYANNVGGSLSLLQAMHAADVRRLVFSSTCAVIGVAACPLVETLPERPINPYGASKLMVERMIQDWSIADPQFAAVILRYFNVAGCSPDGTIGEDHRPETHLIPILLQVALGQRTHATVFGDDYPTTDGTCVRDYVHVDDLCDAHLLALQHLQPGAVRTYHVGIGRGYSVQEVLSSARRVTGHTIPIEMGPRRAGDPPQLYADSTKIRAEMQWSPRFTDLDRVVQTAWNWFEKHPSGYGG